MRKKKEKIVEEIPVITKHTILGQEHNKALLQIAITKNMPALLIGETGTGKTSVVRELADAQKANLIRVNLNGQTSIDEFVGKWLVKHEETVWVDGILVQAMKNGDWLLCDEINAALPEILFVLHSVLDDDKMVLLSEKDGEVIKPHKDFRFFATMNPFDEYAGTKELNKAFLSRFGIALEFEYPSFNTEKEIVHTRTGIKESDANLMIEVARRIRQQKQEGNLYFTISTRDLLYWAEVAKENSLSEGFLATIFHKINNEDKPIVNGIMESVLKEFKALLDKYAMPDDKGLFDLLKESVVAVDRKKKEYEELVRVKEKTLKEREENIEQYVLNRLQTLVSEGNKSEIKSAGSSEEIPF